MWQNEDTPGLQGCPTPLRVHDFWKRPRKKCRNRCEAPSSAGKAPTSRSEIELCIGSSKKSGVTKWTGKHPTKGASVGAAVWRPPTWKRRLLRDYVSSKFMHASKWQTWWQERFLMSVGTCKLTTWHRKWATRSRAGNVMFEHHHQTLTHTIYEIVLIMKLVK